jgi:hypothetical protein
LKDQSSGLLFLAMRSKQEERSGNMSDCCEKTPGKPRNPGKSCCPQNGQEYAEVQAKTITHHLKHPWGWKDEGKRYFFCSDPECDIVYFSEDDAVITRQQLRSVVGVKENNADAPVCYCFGVTRADAMADPSIREYVAEQTKMKHCSCDVSNPSGRCCLKDFPRTL